MVSNRLTVFIPINRIGFCYIQRQHSKDQCAQRSFIDDRIAEYTSKDEILHKNHEKNHFNF